MINFLFLQESAYNWEILWYLLAVSSPSEAILPKIKDIYQNLKEKFLPVTSTI